MRQRQMSELKTETPIQFSGRQKSDRVKSPILPQAMPNILNQQRDTNRKEKKITIG
jgi:hypothetical protein